MLTDALTILRSWQALDTWIVLIAALAAMACALPGSYLVLRRQSMMGDAISHTVLLGIVAAFLMAQKLLLGGWISAGMHAAWEHAFLFVGAMVSGVLSAVLAEAVQKLGKVEASAALGVVFTTLFALGLLLVRTMADNVHIDPDCVLYGDVETAVLDTVLGIPRAALVNGAVLLVNLALVVTFYKELRISAFDPALSTTLGINSQAMHYGLMAMTAVTLVAAFESVGSILVIAMLIVPAATAHLLTDRLSRMIRLSLVIAASSALAGHVLALLVPPLLLSPMAENLAGLKHASASTAGMMAVAAGMFFVLAMFAGPRYGIFSRALHQVRLSLRMVSEDLLGWLYRREEAIEQGHMAAGDVVMHEVAGVGTWLVWFARWKLRRDGLIHIQESGVALTAEGRLRAAAIVRAHRLWESYMQKHFDVPDVHLHETAARVEHYLSPAMQDRISQELDRPKTDPHGRSIPSDSDPATPTAQQSG